MISERSLLVKGTCARVGAVLFLLALPAAPAFANAPLEGPDLQTITVESDADGMVGTRPDRGPFELRLEASSVFPMMVGGGLTLETPGDLRLSLSAGVTPTLYIDAVRAAVGADGLASQSAVESLLAHMEEPFVFRFDYAWKPSWAKGFFISVGYGFIRAAATLPAGEVPEDLWSRIDGMTAESTAFMNVAIHMANAEIGYELDLADHWMMRIAIGGSFTFAARSDMRVSNVNDTAADIDDGSTSADDYIESGLTKYGHTPTVSVSFGYRAF